MIDVEYDLAKARLYNSANPYVRYFDLLPLDDPANLVPFQPPATPVRHARALGKRLGLAHLYLKDETVLPTRTTKDRIATVALSLFRELGVRRFTASSTGNTSTSFAAAMRHYPECRLYLLVGEEFLERLQFEENNQVAVFGLRGATFEEAAAEAVAFAERTGMAADRGFFNPGRREGLKVSFLEAAEAVPRPIDWYVQAVSSAMGVYGVYKGARELMAMGRIGRLPHLLCVQEADVLPHGPVLRGGVRGAAAAGLRRPAAGHRPVDPERVARATVSVYPPDRDGERR